MLKSYKKITKHIDENIEPGTVVKYTYYPQFDNYPVTLEQAYRFYEDHGLCHLYQDGIVKCYQELLNVYPDEYELGDLILTDNI